MTSKPTSTSGIPQTRPKTQEPSLPVSSLEEQHLVFPRNINSSDENETTTTSTSDDEGGLTLSSAVIAIIVVGVVFFVVLVVLLCVLFACLLPSKTARKTFVPTSPENPGGEF